MVNSILLGNVVKLDICYSSWCTTTITFCHYMHKFVVTLEGVASIHLNPCFQPSLPICRSHMAFHRDVLQSLSNGSWNKQLKCE